MCPFSLSCCCSLTFIFTLTFTLTLTFTFTFDLTTSSTFTFTLTFQSCRHTTQVFSVQSGQPNMVALHQRASMHSTTSSGPTSWLALAAVEYCGLFSQASESLFLLSSTTALQRW